MSATHTTNLGLNKPARQDFVSVVSDINQNMDMIDSAIGNIITPTSAFTDKSVAIPLSGWTLTSGLYQYTYTDSDITAGTVVMVDFGNDIRSALVGDLIYTPGTGSVVFKTDELPIGTVNLILHLAMPIQSANGQSF